MTCRLPPSTRVEPDPSLRRRSRGRLLIGGSPLRFIKLTDAGAALVDRWLTGTPVGESIGAQRLARRLVGVGMMHPVPPPNATDLADLTVVIPVKDDPEGLAATLGGLESVPVVVVDDGSSAPIAAPTIVRSPASGEPSPGPAPILIRREHSGGPAAARQDGLRRVASPLVAFVDAGVRVARDDLVRLHRWFADPAIVAVGPRVACLETADYLSRYEGRRSPLDLGPTPAEVRAESPVTYLPTACLVARIDDVDAVGGFDTALRWGEDVDLIWRLLERGQVRYDPSVVVHHPARSSLPAMIRQRIGYGSSASPLARRHGSRLAPVRMSPWSLASWALMFSGHSALGVVLAGATAVALGRKLRPVLPDPEVESALLAARGHWYAGRSLARAGVRVWWPLTLGTFALGSRSLACRVVALAAVDRLLECPGPVGTRLLDWLLGSIDDLAYGTGVWIGVVIQRSGRALAPSLVAWPPRSDGGRDVAR